MGFILVGDFTSNLDAVHRAVDGLRAPPLKKRAVAYLEQVDAMAREEGLT